MAKPAKSKTEKDREIEGKDFKENAYKDIKISLALLLIIDAAFLMWLLPYVDTSNGMGINAYEAKSLAEGHGAVVNIWLDSPERLDVLKENGVRYLFVDVGGVNETGGFFSDERIDDFLIFVHEYERQESWDFVLMPYYEVNTFDVDITSSAFRERLLNSYFTLSGKGFDGFLVDIEPIQHEHREYFIELVQELKSRLPSDKILAVYSGHAVERKTKNAWEWDMDFYRKVSGNVDLISAPGYDSASKTAGDYRDYVKGQVRHVGSLDTNVLFAIPTHKPWPEFSEIALRAYEEEIRQNGKGSIVGVTMFAEWTATESDWLALRSIFEEEENSRNKFGEVLE